MPTYPVFAAGQRLTAAALNSMLWTEITKAANQSTPPSSTTLADDAELFFTAAANASYDVEFVLRFAGLNAAQFKTGWVVPSGTSGNKYVIGPGSANATEPNANTTEMRWAIHGTATTVTYGEPRNSTGLQTFVIERARLDIGGTSGPVKIQWAQGTANATVTSVIAGSTLRYRRIA